MSKKPDPKSTGASDKKAAVVPAATKGQSPTKPAPQQAPQPPPQPVPEKKVVKFQPELFPVT